MGAVDAFHVKAAAFEALHTEGWQRFARGFTSSIRGEQPGTLGVTGFHLSADEFSRAVSGVLSLGETFYIAPQMNALVAAAAEDWPADEVVTDEDFPTDHGWLYIPGGVTNIDVRGTMYTTTALTWAKHGDVIDIIFWADKRNDPPHIRDREGWDELPQMTPWHVTHLDVGDPLPTAIRFGKTLPPEVSEQVQWMDTGRGQQMFFPQGWDPSDMVPHHGPDPTCAWLVSALRIMQQPLATVEHVGLPAVVRKRHAKAKRRVKNTAITVIDFRRRESDFEPGSGREYTHRFLRRGHWRRQPYKREDGTWDRRRIWIHATICGPADAPLVLRNHVNAFTR